MKFKKAISCIVVAVMLATGLGDVPYLQSSTVLAQEIQDAPEVISVIDENSEETTIIEEPEIPEEPVVPEEPEVIPATGVVMDQTAVTVDVNVNKTIVLSASILPAESTETISWTSSDEAVAIVDQTGSVTAVSEGTATITATTESGFSASCEVTVVAPVTDITLSKTTITLVCGSETTIDAIITPEESKAKISWSSASNLIATVEASGDDSASAVITAQKVGVTKITAMTEDGLIAECTLYVSLPKPTNVKTSKSGVNKTKIAWTPVTDATGYIIYRSETSSGGFVKRKTLTTGDSSYYKDAVTNGKKYYYKVRAVYGPNSKCNSTATSAILGKVNPVISVKRFNQYSYGLPSGCEATAAAMLLDFHGVSATPTSFVSKMESLKLIKPSNERPEDYFVGHPTWSGYGCYSKPIVKTMRAMLPSTSPTAQIRNAELSSFTEYLDQGEPLLIWATMTYTIDDSGTYREVGMYNTRFGSSTWYIPRLGKNYSFRGCEHCLVLVGYDATYYYLNDPMNGLTVKCKKATVEKSYNDQGKFAAIIY